MVRDEWTRVKIAVRREVANPTDVDVQIEDEKYFPKIPFPSEKRNPFQSSLQSLPIESSHLIESTPHGSPAARHGPSHPPNVTCYYLSG